MWNIIQRKWVFWFGSRHAKADVWLARKERGFSESEQKRFDNWVAKKPNQEAYFEALTLWHGIDTAKAELMASNNLGIDAADEGNRYSIAYVYAAIAAVVVLGFALLIAYQTSPTAPEIIHQSVVEVEGYKRLPLQDGSVLELKPNTRIEIEYTDNYRLIQLQEGEVFFSVEGDANRPFRVRSQLGEVVAIGTAFSVKHVDNIMEVWVLEGEIEVASKTSESSNDSQKQNIPLVAGQKIIQSIDSGKINSMVTQVTIEEIGVQLQWKDKVINFKSAPLYEIVAEFNRLNDVKLVILTDSLKTQKLSLVIRADNYEDFIEVLQLSLNVEITRSDNMIFLTAIP